MTKTLYYVAIALIVGQLQSCAQTKSNTSMSEKIKLTYVMDPQCGWCYGNSENITALQEVFKDDFDFELHVGGMWLGQNAPLGGDDLSQFIQNQAARMTATAGAQVDKRYYELAKDSTYSFSSLEPSAAIQLVKETSTDKTFLFAKKVQHALFAEGKRLDEKETYIEILKTMALDTTAFNSLWMNADNISKTKKEFIEASNLTGGFPTLVLTKDGQPEALASGYFTKEIMIQKLHQLK